MEHACHQCGAPVEDGTAFCRQCNAPQIRVAGADISAMPVAADVISEQLAGSSPDLRQDAAPLPGIQWSHAMPAAAVAGLVAALAMFVLLGVFGLGLLGGGFISVLLYRRLSPTANLTPGLGAKLGALSGLIGFSIFAFFAALEMAFSHSAGQLRAALLRAVDQAAARSADPQAQAAVEWLKSPSGLAFMMAMALVFTLLCFLVLSSLGGALGAAILRNKQKTTRRGL